MRLDLVSVVEVSYLGVFEAAMCFISLFFALCLRFLMDLDRIAKSRFEMGNASRDVAQFGDSSSRLITEPRVSHRGLCHDLRLKSFDKLRSTKRFSEDRK
jgi:hypothetical protein